MSDDSDKLELLAEAWLWLCTSRAVSVPVLSWFFAPSAPTIAPPTSSVLPCTCTSKPPLRANNPACCCTLA